MTVQEEKSWLSGQRVAVPAATRQAGTSQGPLLPFGPWPAGLAAMPVLGPKDRSPVASTQFMPSSQRIRLLWFCRQPVITLVTCPHCRRDLSSTSLS